MRVQRALRVASMRANPMYVTPQGADINKNVSTSTLYRHSRTQRRSNPVGYGCTAHTHGFQPHETHEFNRFRAEGMLAGQVLLRKLRCIKSTNVC
eukprot:3769757-Pyramimonas_sp.AAC.1